MSKREDDDRVDPRFAEFEQYKNEARKVFEGGEGEQDLAVAFLAGHPLPSRVGGHSKFRGEGGPKGQVGGGADASAHGEAQGNRWLQWQGTIPGIEDRNKTGRAAEFVQQYKRHEKAREAARGAAKSAGVSSRSGARRHTKEQEERAEKITEIESKIRDAVKNLVHKGLKAEELKPGKLKVTEDDKGELKTRKTALARLYEQLSEVKTSTPTASSARSGPARPRVPASASGSSRAAPTPASAPAASAADLFVEAALPPRGIGAHVVGAASARADYDPPYRAASAAGVRADSLGRGHATKRESEEPPSAPSPKRSQVRPRVSEEAADSAAAAASAFGSHIPPSTPLRTALHPAGIDDSARRLTHDSGSRRILNVNRESPGRSGDLVRRGIFGSQPGRAPRPSGKRLWTEGFSKGAAAAAPASPSHRSQADDEDQPGSPTHSTPTGQERGRGGESKRGRGGGR